MRKRHWLAPGILLVTLLAWSPRAHALDPALELSQYAHTSWKVRDGALAGSVNAVTQTPDGYLWLGTEFGLLRFDGVKPVAWRPAGNPGLAAGMVVKLLTGRDGTLWIGGNPGLASLKAGALTPYPDLADQHVTALLEDREGTLWVGTFGTPDGRLCAIRSGAIHCYGEDGGVGEVAGLYEDTKGNLWVGVANGVWRWKPGTPEFHPVPDVPGGVRPLGEDQDGAVLITWRRRIARFVDGRVDPSSAIPGLPDDWAWRFLDDRDGGRWIPMLNRGLARMYRGRTELFAASDGLSGDAVRDVFEDHEGNVWVATLGGLDRFRDLPVATLTQKQGLLDPKIWSVLAARNGDVWMGSPLGLGRWRNGRVERFGRQAGLLDGEAPGSLFEDRRGRVWVSTNREFGYLEGDQFIPVRAVPGGYVFSIAEDGFGDLWIMNQQHGVVRLRGETVQAIPWTALGRTDHVTAAVADPGRGLWLGFKKGGVARLSGDRLSAVYAEKDGLGAGEVLHLRFDAQGALWAATRGGLTRIKGGTVATLSSENGLPCDTVHWSIEDDTRALWVYTACGLVRIDHAELDAWTAAVERDRQATRRIAGTVFDSSDGVRSSRDSIAYRPRVTRTADGRLWFLPVDGVSVFDPRRLVRNTLPPAVYVEHVIADRRHHDAVPGMRLPPLVRDLQIDYTALSLVAPEKNRFRVMLEGRDHDWQDVGTRREAFYTDLLPGAYRFRVMGSNNHGVWNEVGTALEFSIAPAYYQTRWFKVMMAAAALALLWAGFRVRVHQVEREYHRRLDERVNERMRIARELHDTLLQSFHGLLLRFQTAACLLPDHPAEARDQLDKAIERAATAITEGRNAVQGLRASAVERNDLAVAIKTLGDELSSDLGPDRHPTIEVAVEGHARDLHPIVRDEIYKIAGEALRNAFRHAQAGRVEVDIRYGDAQFRLHVRDDGKGIDPDVLATAGREGHYGLRGMPERAAVIGGTLSVWSKPGAGTEVELRLPGSTVYAMGAKRSWLSRLRRSAVVALVAALSSTQPATAQTAPSGGRGIVQASWTFKDGAPPTAAALAQTADGYLWVGAPSGLFRFDGVRFELFRSPFGDRLLSTNVSTLLAADGGLWVGYVFGGFSFLKNGRVKNFAEQTASVSGFAADGHGITWAGGVSHGGGLWRFEGSSWQHVGVEWNVPDQPVSQLGFDREGTLWVLLGMAGPESPKQLMFLAPDSRKFQKAADGLFVLGFTRDADGYVLTRRTSNEGQGARPAYPILREQSEQTVDLANNIWVIPRDPVVMRHPAGQSLPDSVTEASPSNSDVIPINPRVHAILVDREGSVWIGTETAVYRFSYSPLVQQQLPATPAPWFMVAPDDGGAVWISAGDGVGKSTLYRVAAGHVELQKAAAGVSSFAYRAPDKTFWFGGEGGLWQMTGGRLTQVELPKELADKGRVLVTMTHDGSGGFWVSFAGLGLYRLKDGGWTKYQRAPAATESNSKRVCPATAVLSAFTDRSSRVWLGCTKGQLAVLDGDRAQAFSPDDGLEVGNVTAIYGRESALWIGGEFGLQQLDHGRFRTIQAIDGESLRGISGLVETANGDVWLNGLGGVVHIRQAEIKRGLDDPGYRVSTERFDRQSGLPGLASQLRHMPSAIEATDGRLWFAVNDGVVWLDPTGASTRTPPPPVSIQSVTADDRVVGLDESPKFPAGTSSVQIGYAAVSLLSPEAIRFRYRLREVDSAWHEAGRSTSVSYRSLRPGPYHFEVSATDANGRWSDDTATFVFATLPAYYQTRWFRALCAMLLLLLAFAGYHLRIRQLQHQFEMTLDARVSERTRIARDLHDTLLQSFHGLLLRFQTASCLITDHPAQAKGELDKALAQAAAAITTGRDAIQGLRDSALETNDLALAVSTLGRELTTSSARPPEFSVEVEGDSRELHPIVRDEIYKLAGEALRNAFQHAEAGKVEADIHYGNDEFRLQVRDDGKGMDREVLARRGIEGHYGLGGMTERATLIGGKLAVWSELGSGTEVELRLPARTAYAISRRRTWWSRLFAATGEPSGDG